MFKSLLQKSGMIFIASSLAMGLTACDESDVGLIAIGIGVVAICADNDVHCSYESHPRHRQPHRDRYDRHGHRRGGDGNWGSRNLVSPVTGVGAIEAAPPVITQEDVVAMGQESIDTLDWSLRFDLKEESSARIIAALEKSRAGDKKALAAIGLTRSDVLRLSRQQMPFPQSVNQMSKKLGEDKLKLEVMFQELAKAGELVQ